LSNVNPFLFRGRLEVDYLHSFIDVQDISWSDRSYYFADADFVDVPLKGLVIWFSARILCGSLLKSW
jgi:gamma-glutamyltranspeptidase